MDMNQEKNQKNRSPHHDGGGLLAQVQASVEILSPVPVGGKCREKDYERLFIREPEVKAREGKMAYVRPEYHDRIMRITRVIGHDRLSLSAYIDHVLTHHFNQCEEAIKSLYARNYEDVYKRQAHGKDRPDFPPRDFLALHALCPQTGQGKQEDGK